MTNLHSSQIQKQSGIALVIVLWMLSLLIILAIGYSRMVRVETSLTANMVHFAQAKAIAEAGIWQSIEELLKPKTERRWKTDGTDYTFRFGAGTTKVNITNETGKIDLNTARSELLYGLINSNGLSEQDSLILLQSILDWRDKDNLQRNHGAEDSDYRLQGFDYGAKDGLFNNLDELQLVMGMNTAIFKRLKPALTIHSHQTGINPNYASKTVLLAIPGISEAQVDDFLVSRADNSDTQAPLSLAGIDSKYLSRINSSVFSIKSEGIIGETHARLDVVVLMKRYLNTPYAILSWQESTGLNKTEVEMDDINHG